MGESLKVIQQMKYLTTKVSQAITDHNYRKPEREGEREREQKGEGERERESNADSLSRTFETLTDALLKEKDRERVCY